MTVLGYDRNIIAPRERPLMTGHGLVVLIGLASFVLFAIVLPIWTYNDAQQNSDQSAVLWALVVFFGGIIGILLYLILGRNGPGQRGRREPSRY